MVTNDDKVRFTLRLPSKVMEGLKDEANQRGLTINALIAGVIWGYVQEAGKERRCEA